MTSADEGQRDLGEACLQMRARNQAGLTGTTMRPLREMLQKSGISPRSGRLVIAQHFSAGIRNAKYLVREADG